MSAPSVTDASYTESAARGMLDSLEHYGHTCPPVGDGRVSTPAWYANRLGKVLHARGDELPGDAGDWWGDRWAAYARQLLETPAPAEHTCYGDRFTGTPLAMAQLRCPACPLPEPSEDCVGFADCPCRRHRAERARAILAAAR